MSRDTVSPDQLRRMVGGEVTTDRRGRVQTGVKRSKYGNRQGVYVAEVDRRFDSQREANEAVKLLIQQQRGEIRGLRFQVSYPLNVNGLLVCTYRSDFVFEEPGPRVVKTTIGRTDFFDTRQAWVTVVADAKGFKTDVYRLKKRLMLAVYGIEIREL